MLELKNIVKSYRQPNGEVLPILDIPKFSLSEGEQCLLLGKSGCGKTTLLNVISGISLPDDGFVVIDNIDVCSLSESARDWFRADKIGFVFQTFNLLKGFSALENVLLTMQFGSHQPDTNRAKQLLDRVGLSHRLSHPPNRLSVGEQQRVAVARALANSPKVLLADEPTANVDPGNQQQVIDLIRTSCEEDKVALLLVTHSPEVANQFDRVEHLEQFNNALGKA